MQHSDELDPAIHELQLAIASFPGLICSASYWHPEDRGSPKARWCAHFRPRARPTMSAYAAIEFIASLKREAQAAGFDIELTCNAFPPALNGLCTSLYFVLEGRTGDPGRFAQWLLRMKRLLLLPG